MPTLDVVVLIAYVAAVVAVGCSLVRRSRTPEQFTAAGRRLPGWAVGLSIFGTYLSSNTFLGIPGRAYGTDWNFFAFSLSLPVAAWIAVRFFVPFYRRSGEISAYHHLEARFGPWARVYAVVCYLLTQLARVGTILFGTALVLHALLGWDIATVIVATGILVTVYTLLGGIEAVIWTDVTQAIVLTIGAVLAFVLLLTGVPGGPERVVEIAVEHDKLSLGSFGPSLAQSTFWVVLVYGLFINLSNFGIDQSFVQRYHTARSDRAAARSVWLGAWVYVPVSALFFAIGTALFAFDAVHPGALGDTTEPDRVFPGFIVKQLPAGVSGLVIAALFAAAMSSIDSSLNSSATVFERDVWSRWIRRSTVGDPRSTMRTLRATTLALGALGTLVAVSMIGVESVLRTWWTWQGVFAGGVLGLFLLGAISRRASSPVAAIAVVLGVLVILWTTLSSEAPTLLPDWAVSSLHGHLTIVVGTLTIFVCGTALATWLRPRPIDMR